jgi:hypothetical protein
MNKKESYQQWRPLPELTEHMIVEKLEDTDDGLAIFLEHPMPAPLAQRTVKLLFDGYIAYRNMDESYRLRTWNATGGFQSSLHLVTNSDWLEWLHKESEGCYQDANIKHYAILTIADCIDVLSEFEPQVSWV